MENVNSVAVFYADRTYKHVTWANATQLHGPLSKQIIMLHVYQVTSPGFPGQLVVNGFDDYCLRNTADGLIVRYGSMPPADPEAAFECYFGTNGSQIMNTEIMPQLCMGASEAAFQSLDHSHQDYDTLDELAGAVNLSEETVPGSGTY